MKDDGYEIHHGGKLVTVFSAPNYCDQVLQLSECKPITELNAMLCRWEIRVLTST